MSGRFFLCSHFVYSLPFCLLVGNHSSGKSSFINYLLQRNIQKAGVAPTDDTFTVIAPGPVDTGTLVRYGLCEENRYAEVYFPAFFLTSFSLARCRWSNLGWRSWSRIRRSSSIRSHFDPPFSNKVQGKSIEFYAGKLSPFLCALCHPFLFVCCEGDTDKCVSFSFIDEPSNVTQGRFPVSSKVCPSIPSVVFYRFLPFHFALTFFNHRFH